jgi:hypothetical protein
LFPEEEFEINEIVRDDNEEIEMIVTTDKQGRVAFITDLWNVAQMQPEAQPGIQPVSPDPAGTDINALLQIEDYAQFIDVLEQQTQQDSSLVPQRDTIIQQWQQRHPGTHTVAI